MVCGTAFAPQKSVELFFSVFFFSFPLVRPKKHTHKKKQKNNDSASKKKNKINNTHANKKTDESQTGQISPLNIVSIVFSVSFFFFFFFFLFDYIYIYIFPSIVIALKDKKKKTPPEERRELNLIMYLLYSIFFFLQKNLPLSFT